MTTPITHIERVQFETSASATQGENETTHRASLSITLNGKELSDPKSEALRDTWFSGVKTLSQWIHGQGYSSLAAEHHAFESGVRDLTQKLGRQVNAHTALILDGNDFQIQPLTGFDSSMVKENTLEDEEMMLAMNGAVDDKKPSEETFEPAELVERSLVLDDTTGDEGKNEYLKQMLPAVVRSLRPITFTSSAHTMRDVNDKTPHHRACFSIAQGGREMTNEDSCRVRMFLGTTVNALSAWLNMQEWYINGRGSEAFEEGVQVIAQAATGLFGLGHWEKELQQNEELLGTSLLEAQFDSFDAIQLDWDEKWLEDLSTEYPVVRLDKGKKSAGTGTDSEGEDSELVRKTENAKSAKKVIKGLEVWNSAETRAPYVQKRRDYWKTHKQLLDEEVFSSKDLYFLLQGVFDDITSDLNGLYAN